MNKSIFAAIVLASASLGANAFASESEATHRYNYSLDDINEVSIDAGVGTLDVTHTDGTELRVELELVGKRGFFGFRKRDVSEIEVEERVRGDRLSLKLNEDDLDHVEAHWRVELPSVARTHINLGVGKIDAEFGDTELILDVGVGAADISLARAFVGRVETAAGVGDVELIGAKDVVSTRAIVAEQSHGYGDGEQRMELNVGVGEIKVYLQDEI